MTAPSPDSWPQHQVAPQDEPPKSRKGLLIGGIVGGVGCLLVLLIAVALIVFFVVRGGSGSGGGAGGGGDSTADLSPEEQMTALVTDYMDAISNGDSAAAFEVAPLMDDTATQLPAEAYDAALEAAPVEDVEISEPVMDYETSGTISVSFTVDGESVAHEFMLYAEGTEGSGVLSNGLGAYTAVPSSLGGLGLTLNGAAVEDEDTLVLLPGAYSAAIDVEHFELNSEDPVTVTDEAPGLRDLEPALTEDGLTAFRGAVQKSVDACLEQKTLEAGCGIGTLPSTTSDGWTLTEDTVRRSLPEESQRNIDKMEATPSYDEPTYVSGSAVGTVDTEMDCTKDGQEGTCEMWFGGGMSTPNVDMADPELPVTWS